ncbi:MAG: hypothetical protein JNG85_16315, partial [Spirochaetaceae bacterium]|nr:hypothetical protein [Spirochaetaceae bacterium]
MLSLIRGGPRILLVEPEGPAFAEGLARLGRECGRFEEAFESGDGASTIVALVSALGRGGEPVRLAELERVFLLPLPVEEFLLRLFEPGRPPLRGVRMAPRIVLFRGVGDLDAVVGRIEEELGAFPGRLLDLLDREDSGSIVCVSGASLEGRVGFSDLHPIALHVPLAARNPLELETDLRRNGLRYLNAGRGDRDWTDLEIKVYDRYEEYGLQLERI